MLYDLGGFLTELWDGVSLKRSTGPYSGLKWDIIGMFFHYSAYSA